VNNRLAEYRVGTPLRFWYEEFGWGIDINAENDNFLTPA
jgi:hypothetical protein